MSRKYVERDDEAYVWWRTADLFLFGLVGFMAYQRYLILDDTDCISHSTNTLGKGMNPIILPPAMGK